MSFTLQTASFSSIDDMAAKCSMKSDNKRHTIAIGGTTTVKDISFIIDWCTVKTLPDKYDKLWVSIPPDAERAITKLMTSVYPSAEPVIKGHAIGIKVAPAQQKAILAKFKVGEMVKAQMKFDAAYTYGDKLYIVLKFESMEKIELDLM
jgi:hypothetical protein